MQNEILSPQTEPLPLVPRVGRDLLLLLLDYGATKGEMEEGGQVATENLTVCNPPNGHVILNQAPTVEGPSHNVARRHVHLQHVHTGLIFTLAPSRWDLTHSYSQDGVGRLVLQRDSGAARQLSAR